MTANIQCCVFVNWHSAAEFWWYILPHSRISFKPVGKSHQVAQKGPKRNWRSLITQIQRYLLLPLCVLMYIYTILLLLLSKRVLAISVGRESACNAGDPSWIPGSGRFPWRRDRLPTPVFLGFPCGSAGKESTCGRPGFNPWVGKIPWRREGLPTLVF